MYNQFKTMILLALLSGILITIGAMTGGQEGAIIAFGIALVMNIGSYWFSDSAVLKMYHAQEISEADSPSLHKMVSELAENAGIPKPRIYRVPEQAPNAFATGRNPSHAVVAVTDGILPLLTQDELRGVLGHEIAHVAHRDILISTVASVIGSAITMLANMLQLGSMRGSRQGKGNPLALIVMAMLAPIAASIIRMSISRSREYLADADGAKFSGNPLMLASALNKLQNYSQRIAMQRGNSNTENMFIVQPSFAFGGMKSLFSTHPDTNERIARLQEMARTGEFNA